MTEIKKTGAVASQERIQAKDLAKDFGEAVLQAIRSDGAGSTAALARAEVAANALRQMARSVDFGELALVLEAVQSAWKSTGEVFSVSGAPIPQRNRVVDRLGEAYVVATERIAQVATDELQAQGGETWDRFAALEDVGFNLVFISDNQDDATHGQFMFLGGPLVIDGQSYCEDPRLRGASSLADLVDNVWAVVTTPGIGVARPSDDIEILAWDGQSFVAAVRGEDGCFPEGR